ncbi:hypothetical protein P175DRAFT_0500873 [Aspergillus ochraceoroseus IBT 24754]|uniref:Uncharacterized protein n=1 Tax=Aspergillus ochraceoroseus IBT 24754 TaxID=1392256 RepID=A0A2T5M0D8_9EURO|nr:uncharacterized protein P175DRAFT_0500873 [Aspergillus ochraceoroseus IBT 24754]PTU22001.1 hypothetical protein P175DRAFT_0500873 [Aspergillus ochraceoroseus IBT 24754]
MSECQFMNYFFKSIFQRLEETAVTLQSPGNPRRVHAAYSVLTARLIGRELDPSALTS